MKIPDSHAAAKGFFRWNLLSCSVTQTGALAIGCMEKLKVLTVLSPSVNAF